MHCQMSKDQGSRVHSSAGHRTGSLLSKEGLLKSNWGNEAQKSPPKKVPKITSKENP